MILERMMQEFGVAEYRACATSALRELANPLIVAGTDLSAEPGIQSRDIK